jgi:hypothetical protein
VLGAANDKLMTLAPRLTASRIAFAVTPPRIASELVILMEMTRARGATPVNETPACGAAAMMLATAVPWPTQSAPAATPGTRVERSGPTVTRSPNCGFASTPLSMTATVTPAPSVRPHTLEKLSACWAHGVVVGGAAPWPPPQPAVGSGSCPASAERACGAAVSACAVAQAGAAADPRTARQGATSATTRFEAQRTSTSLRHGRRLRMSSPINTDDPRFSLNLAGTKTSRCCRGF